MFYLICAGMLLFLEPIKPVGPPPDCKNFFYLFANKIIQNVNINKDHIIHAYFFKNLHFRLSRGTMLVFDVYTFCFTVFLTNLVESFGFGIKFCLFYSDPVMHYQHLAIKDQICVEEIFNPSTACFVSLVSIKIWSQIGQSSH